MYVATLDTERYSIMHQAVSEVLTSCIAVKFGVAISDDM